MALIEIISIKKRFPVGTFVTCVRNVRCDGALVIGINLCTGHHFLILRHIKTKPI